MTYDEFTTALYDEGLPLEEAGRVDIPVLIEPAFGGSVSAFGSSVWLTVTGVRFDEDRLILEVGEF